MKKIYFTAILATLFGSFAQAQTPIIDSIETGGSYANSVYYSLRDGKVKQALNSEWQIALSIGTFNVTARANTMTNGSADGFAVVYEKPGADTTQWTNFDTTGHTAWQVLNNSDQDWESGAFNTNSSGQFDYGWGVYDPSSHIVVGQRLYLMAIKSGSSTVYKKVFIMAKDLGVWTLRYANLDGTGLQDLEINSANYTGKSFAYVNLLTNQVLDREPAQNGWDFVLTRYDALQPSSIYYLSVGILTNSGVLTAEVKGKEETTATIADTIGTSDDISVIGFDWKSLNMTTFKFDVVDSLCYFVKATDGAFWKLVFTGFASGSSPSGTGRAIFTKTKITFGTGVTTVGNQLKNVTVYPNPSSGEMDVLFESTQSSSVLEVVDLTGKSVYTATISSSSFTHQHLDLSSLNKGVYFLNVMSGDSRSVQRIMIN